jgi:uncharacterized protein YfkK (UPF0435 family)
MTQRILQIGDFITAHCSLSSQEYAAIAKALKQIMEQNLINL